MMNLDLKSVTIHPFLFVIFPLYFLFFNNIHELAIQQIFLPILLALFGIFVLFILLKRLLKNGKKAGVMLSFLLILYILYKYITSALNTIDNVVIITSFSIVFVLGIYFLVKTKNKLDNTSTIFNAVSLTMILFVSLNIGIYYLENPEIKSSESLEILLLPDIEQTTFPDIYYIILDEYAGSESLQRNFNYDNSDFILELSNRGFYIPSFSFSNYPNTSLALPSSLNMQYINFIGEETSIESKDTRLSNSIFKENLVMKNLKSKGYYIISFDTSFGGVNSFKLSDERLCSHDHYFNFLKLIIANTLEPITTFLPMIDSYEFLIYENARETISCKFSELAKISDRTSQPQFTFAHLFFPHYPYIYDSDGKHVTLPIGADLETYKKFYLEQLIFANKKTLNLIDTILEKSQSPPIIIIQSDHGVRRGINLDNPTEEMIFQGLNNLNAYYLPNGTDALYETISPVNSFRVVFNEYFNADFELLEDKYYWNTLDRPYDVKNVTEIVTNFRN